MTCSRDALRGASQFHNLFSFPIARQFFPPHIPLWLRKRKVTQKGCSASDSPIHSPAMRTANKADSKLCADNPRNVTSNFLSEIVVTELGRGRGFAPSRCTPSRFATARSEIVSGAVRP